MLEQIAEHEFDSTSSHPKRGTPEHIFLIDPIIIPSDKILTLVKLAGPLLGNSPNLGDSTQNAHWYVNRPEEDLQQLYDLINKVKNYILCLIFV